MNNTIVLAIEKKKKKKKEKEKERERERGEIVFDAQKQFSKMLQCAKTNPKFA
jgi:vacuolar-type H+-ATPase subunit H